MKIKITDKIDESSILFIPIKKNDTTKDCLSAINKAFDLGIVSLETDFKGDSKESLLLFTKEKQKIFLLGLGSNPTSQDILATCRNFSYQQKNRLTSKICVLLEYSNLDSGDFTSVAETIAIGLIQGTYQIGLHKSEAASIHPLAEKKSIITMVAAHGKLQKTVEEAPIIAFDQIEIFNMVNEPANFKTPSMLAKKAQASGKKYGYAVKILDKKAIQKEGLSALLSVSIGSPEPPVFIIMEYKPKKSVAKIPKIGLVGKGVTFDTGGVSLKDSANLHYMKSDMGGAAAVFGTMNIVAQMELPIHLIGIVPSTENCIDGLGIKPGDVIDSYLGKTIEVIDTDAEGRLILADGLTYMKKHFEPDTIIDLATLTGSAVQTFGYHSAAMFCNNDDLAKALLEASVNSGERIWQLPLWDVYAEDISSDIADLRNFSGKPMAGAISAAKFLEVFTDKHSSWAHLDIAGVAFGNMEFGAQKCATAFGVRLLLEFLKSLIK